MLDITTEKIIHILLEKDEPITSKQIAKEINMSLSTVKHNMRYVREYIESCGAELQLLPRKGFLLQGEEKRLQELANTSNDPRNKAYSFDFRKHYILDILFQRNSNYTVQIFADDLAVGRTIITKDLELIKNWLSYFDLKLSIIKNRGVCLQGNEFNKRQAIIFENNSYFNEEETQTPMMDGIDYRIDAHFYHYFLHCYPNQDLMMLQKLLLDAETTLKFTYDEISFTQLCEYIALSLIRISTGNIIEEANILNRAKISDLQYEASRTLINTALPFYNKENLTMEYHCLAAQFALNGAYDRASSTIKMDYYEAIAEQFIQKLKSIIVNKKIITNDGLISDLGMLFQKKKLQKSYQMMNGTSFIRDIKKDLPSLYGIVLTNIQPIEQKLHIKFSENDIAYITMLLSNALKDDLFTLRIILVTTKDENTSRYIRQKVSKSLSFLNKISTLHYEQINQIDQEYDLLVSPLPLTDKSEEEYLLISPRFDNQDILLIDERLKQIQKEKQSILVSNNLFHENLIALHYHAKTKDEALAYGSSLLEQHHYVTPEFITNIKVRESILPTSIGNGVSIPHEYKKHLNQGAISVLILDHPIIWAKDEKVDLVFTMALDFTKNSEIGSFFAHFYELIENESLLDRIRQSQDASEVMEVLNEIGLTAGPPTLPQEEN